MIELGIVKALLRAQEAKDRKAVAQAEALASVLKAVKLDGFQDVPLPQAEIVTETKRFSPDLREALEKKGFRVYTLTGQSISSEKAQGRKFWSTWHRDYPKFEALTSIHSEVAIDPDPDKFFIPKSNNKTLDHQLEMVADHSQKLQKTLTSEVSAVMGEAPDYVDLTFSHLDTLKDIKDRLFGEKYGYNFTRTKTPTVESLVADVGDFHADRGLHVSYWYRGDGPGFVFAAPLVVPRLAEAMRGWPK